ncbi:ABC transporter substrate-binding protein [Roseiarcaceae bacterium H3SJ34-1]|uniref:ABC transporter substrate-binding protein n=1 Tax=Terripilifer ovatus TaxID=3032367 RepID=UPI003AB92688|nr:ABC transporter substrate-binding protein [Roseiarcaceae bacterium H3SJ34-1]
MFKFGLIGSFAACFVSAASAQEVINIGWVPAMVSSPLVIAEEKGYFKQQGLKVELSPIQSVSVGLPMLSTNRIQILEGGLQGGLFNALARGFPVAIVADRASTPLGHTLMVRKDLSSTVKTLADLKGKVVATNATGSTLSYELDKLLQTAGLNLNDVETKVVSFTQLSAAFSNKAIDAAIAITPISYQLEEQGVALPLLSIDDVLPNMTMAVTLINTDWAKEKPKAAEGFFYAMFKAVREFCQAYHNGSNRQEIADIMLRTRVVDNADLLKHFWGSRRVNGTVNVQALRDVVAWYRNEKLLSADLPDSKLFDSRFVDRAASQLGPFVLENPGSGVRGCD